MNKSSNNFKVPDTLVIVFFILLFFIGFTHIIPAGEYLRTEVNERTVLVANSYQEVTANPQPLVSVFTAPLKGFSAAAEIIAFILFVGGAFGIINATGAISAGLAQVVSICHKKPIFQWILLPVIIILFSLAGATFGMSEEVLVFILITLPLAKALKLDPILGVAIPFVGAGAGFAGAILNPFTIGIAQSIAEIPLFSGWEYRTLVWLIFTGITVAYLMIYAYRITKNPDKKLLHFEENEQEDKTLENLTLSRMIVLIIFGLGICLLIWGVSVEGWYMVEIGGLFLGMGIISGVIGRLSAADINKAFVGGAKEMMTAALVVAMCKGILVIATDGKIIDTILYALSDSVQGLPRSVSVMAMLAFQSSLNFLLPSGSGQAALTMPILSPLSDLLDISRQTTVLAFQFGDGLTNLIIPTSGVTMGVLSIAKVPYQIWLKWMLPLMLVLFFAAGALLLIPLYFQVW
ncbi:YfcC family protein [Persicobacter sp. CCB-QB2]|uniref:YfcC family protein n=1 Tax=Persicobacter sp. CCB-QB2 TaxID=1561025 RepID=UPI0006A9D950|nr:TIGR00366 family protein [Persicobacter sp. CCB-QB2]